MDALSAHPRVTARIASKKHKSIIFPASGTWSDISTASDRRTPSELSRHYPLRLARLIMLLKSGGL